MKTLRLFSVLAGLATIFLAGMSFTSSTDNALLGFDYFAPDFRVSYVTASGGLCEGTQNKVRVTVTNNGNSGYKQDIPVRLAVSQKGSKTQYYIGKVRRGFSGRDSRGKAVWFHNIKIKNQEKVTLTAEVNYDKSVTETAYGNNRKSTTVKPKGKCGESVAQTGKTLSVKVFDTPSSPPRTGLYVEVRKGSFVKAGNTGNAGTAYLKPIPTGSYNVLVRQGTAVVEERTYIMPNYNASLNIVLD